MSESPRHVSVDLGDRSYEIVVGANLLAKAGQYISPVLPQQRAIIITDTNVAKHHLTTVEFSLKDAGVVCDHIIVPAGESSKSFAQLEKLLEELLSLKPERKTALIALGGGVIGDLTGFAASILLRGVPFVQIPTTLLAQVDSSVGGKTGINTTHGKNLVGSFYQPLLVLADTQCLSTLPEREVLAGYAEVVKYGLINDAPFFHWLEQNSHAMISGMQQPLLAKAVEHSCQAKAGIVAQDEREGGVRALLNLGHTFGHALEAETGYSSELLHGEAVAIGMAMAFELSAELGLCSAEDVQRVHDHLRAVKLPSKPADIRASWDAQALFNHFAQDKKVADGKLTFILARGIGQSFITQDVPADTLMKLLERHAGIE